MDRKTTKMKFPFRIPPFGNWTVSEPGVAQVENDTNDDPIVARMMRNKEQMRINKYSTGEVKAVFSIPVKSGKEMFHAAFPDPILLYLSTAHKQFEVAEFIRTDLFPKEAMTSVGGEDRAFNSHVDSTNDTYNSFIQSRVCAIIMLHATVEAFVNDLVPDDISFPYTDRSGNQRLLTKPEVLWLGFSEKVKNVILHISNSDLITLHADTVDKIVFIAQVRNDFIHLKQETIDGFKSTYTEIFHEMLKMDLSKYLDAVHDFINLLKPGYIKYH